MRALFYHFSYMMRSNEVATKQRKTRSCNNDHVRNKKSRGFHHDLKNIELKNLIKHKQQHLLMPNW